ncbi:hypothetical protein LJK88_24440 [Paenibacillus sp. P26]|nr:hypothetical protein LJK88_24440 [Paenibacillus sp. P26]
MSGCGNGGTESKPGDGAAPGEVKDLAASKEPVTINFYRPFNATTEDDFNKMMGMPLKRNFPM